MTRWTLLIVLMSAIGCDHGSDPIRRVPPDRYDGSLFDARRPFDPANPRKPGPGYGSGASYGASYGEEPSDSQPTPGGEMAQRQSDANVDMLDAGIIGGTPVDDQGEMGGTEQAAGMPTGN